MNRKLLLAFILALALGSAGPARANTLNILWYTGGAEATGPGTYEAAINSLAAEAPASPGANNWNVTFWAGGALPVGNYNALVVASPEGGWANFPDYSSLASAGLTFNATTNRILLTGQDADYHDVFSTGPSSFDGPSGFLLNAVNWAASGNGMGLVQLGFNSEVNVGVNSNLNVDPTLITGGYTQTFHSTDNVVIPTAESGFPINTNLTSAGISGWTTASHNDFEITDTTQWTGINLDGTLSTDPCSGPTCEYVTIVSSGSAAGGLTTGVPEPTSLISMVGLSLITLIGLRRRRTSC